MNEDPAFLRTVSLYLSRVLEECGLNKLTMRTKSNSFLFYEQLQNVQHRVPEQDYTFYHFGSQTEGATTPGLTSDVDTLYCYHKYNVIESWSDWQPGKMNLLMLQDRTAPGYCRLQALCYDFPIAVKEVLYDEIFTRDGDGRVIMKNTEFVTPDPERQEVRNGPAISFSGDYGLENDVVRGLPCKTWPAQAEELVRRHRRHGWPSQNLLQEAVKHGVFLVPVGYKLSSTEHLEWRISASLTERCLMFSLNTAHIKCYVVLKILVKTFIEPRASKCISSYHCKTAILYNVENTEPGFWREDNLLKCVIQCLTLLLTWVTDEHCPNFVIADKNLFAGKVTAQNRNLLQSIFKDLITRSFRALLQVHIDDIGCKLQGKLFTIQSVVPVLDALEIVPLIAAFDFEINRHIQINYTIQEIIVNKKNTYLVAVIRFVYKTIVMCKRRISYLEKHERHATKVITENLSRWLGSLMASFLLSHEKRVPRMAIQLLYIEYDVSSTLKLASVLYCNGYFRKVEHILSEIEKHVISNTMQSVCGCYDKHEDDKHEILNHEFVQKLFLQRGRRARARLILHCVRFSPQELHCTPPALRNELFRSVGDDLQHRDEIQDDWMDLAAVDCLPCLYYVQYITYRQLGKRDLQRQSLHNLDRCLREYPTFGHLETGWNLMGQCKELEQEPDSALACYKTSLKIKPRNNAANWHVATLCYTFIQSHIMPL